MIVVTPLNIEGGQHLMIRKTILEVMLTTKCSLQLTGHYGVIHEENKLPPLSYSSQHAAFNLIVLAVGHHLLQLLVLIDV